MWRTGYTASAFIVHCGRLWQHSLIAGSGGVTQILGATWRFAFREIHWVTLASTLNIWAEPSVRSTSIWSGTEDVTKGGKEAFPSALNMERAGSSQVYSEWASSTLCLSLFAVCSSHFIKMSPFPFLFACGISPGLQVHPVPPAGEMNVLWRAQ